MSASRPTSQFGERTNRSSVVFEDVGVHERSAKKEPLTFHKTVFVPPVEDEADKDKRAHTSAVLT
jgi:hypothetical protein